MDSDELFEKEYENLNDAILQAIVSSTEVQEILIKLKKQGETNDIAVLNLFLSLDELHEMISEKKNLDIDKANADQINEAVRQLSNDSCVYKAEPTELNTLKHEEDATKQVCSNGKNENFIDGKPLTINEILFENFCQGQFNEETWKKKARIRL